jgi:hypothetical protein
MWLSKTPCLLERLIFPRWVHLRESELHDHALGSTFLVLVPFGLSQGQEPLGFGGLPQVKLRAAEMGLDAPRILHLGNVLVIGLQGKGVL